MTAKRKISKRKILQVVLSLIVTTCCVIAMVSASKIEDNTTVKSVAVYIKNDKKYHFIEQEEIKDLAINSRNVDVEHTTLSKLDIHSMEQVILADPWVANAQVFIDNDHVLNIYVTQRIPVARVFQQNNVSYYMDTTLSIMPLSKNYIYYTTVVTNVPVINNDSIGWDMRNQIVSLARTLQADTFWNSQISQVVVDSPGMFELTPVLGDQRIILGDVSRVNDKLNNLFLFYKNVLNRIGWDKYETLDLRFKDQIVAKPSLPYNGPVDKAVTGMNWINSIVETEAKNASQDSLKIADTKAITPAPEKAADKKEVPKIISNAARKEMKKQGYKTKLKAAQKQNNNKSKVKSSKAKKSPKYIYYRKAKIINSF